MHEGGTTVMERRECREGSEHVTERIERTVGGHMCTVVWSGVQC